MIKLLLLLLFTFPVYAGVLSGTVSGLAAGSSVVLKSGKFSKIISTNGPYSMTDGGAVTIGIQPSGQVCTVSGTNVTCQGAYTVGGTITGLTSTGLTLRLNNSSSLIVAQNATSYKFSSSLVAGSTYSVTVGIQPVGLKCTVANSLGIIQNNVTNANVSCLGLVSTSVFWTQPTQNTDGTPLIDLTGYILQYGTDPTLTTGYSSKLISVPNLSTTITTLVPGNTYYFTISSVSTSGGTGPRSNFATLSVQ